MTRRLLIIGILTTTIVVSTVAIATPIEIVYSNRNSNESFSEVKPNTQRENVTTYSSTSYSVKANDAVSITDNDN